RFSGFNQSVISIFAFVDYSDAVGVRVPEHHKVFRRFTNLQHRFFGGHWFDRVPSGTDDARFVSFRLNGRHWARRNYACRWGVMLSSYDLSFDLERLTTQSIDRLRR